MQHFNINLETSFRCQKFDVEKMSYFLYLKDVQSQATF